MDLFIGKIAPGCFRFPDIIGPPGNDFGHVGAAVLSDCEDPCTCPVLLRVLRSIVDRVLGAADRNCIGSLAVSLRGGYLPHSDLSPAGRLFRLDNRHLSARDRDIAGLGIQCKSGRGTCLFERIGTGRDRQYIGSAVLFRCQCPHALSFPVIEGIDCAFETVEAAVQGVGLRIQGTLFHLHAAGIGFIGQFRPGDGSEALGGFQGENAAVLFISCRCTDLAHVISPAGKDLEQVGFSVFTCRESAQGGFLAARVLLVRIEGVFCARKRLRRICFLLDNTDFCIAGCVGNLDPHAFPLCHFVGSEGSLGCLVSLRCGQLLEIIGARRAVKDRLVPKTALSAHTHGDHTQLRCHIPVTVDLCLFGTGLICVDAEIDLSPVFRLKEVIAAVTVLHIRIRGGFRQDDPGGFLLLNKTEHIGLHPIAVALGASADIDMHPVQIRKGLCGRAASVGGDQGEQIAAHIGAVIGDPRKLRVAH